MTLHVGPDKRPFHVWMSFLCAGSPYFAGAFNNDFKESEEKALTLPNTGPETFIYFLEWLHSRRLTDGEGNARAVVRCRTN